MLNKLILKILWSLSKQWQRHWQRPHAVSKEFISRNFFCYRLCN